MNTLFIQAKQASRELNLLSDDKINHTLLRLADATEAAEADILAANALDLARMEESNPMYDRLRLTPERIREIADAIRSVAALPSPLGKTLDQWTQPNGMTISKVSVPFGVIGIIYEARPNVTFDVFSLCFKSGSAVVMKGGHDAAHSNAAITALIHSVLREEGINEAVATMLPVEREYTAALLDAVGYVDLIIPRGGRGLIDYVRDNSRVPVIETGAGLCHTYFHASGHMAKGQRIVMNAKTRRVSVCNALDCLLIDAERLPDLATLVMPLAEKKVEIAADEAAYAALEGKYPYLVHATAEAWDTEWRDYKMAVRTVAGEAEAIEHIALHGSGHSECIVAEDQQACDRFCKQVDASCVYANVPTSFTDGGQFGFGAEIGISTQKLHARGPMGLPEITTYKYLITGNAPIRK
ncbi:MAG: glutamate-5-semialdehyde dehydrogenase [Bacteroidales bacterium]|nr:glutamate-5-semialdehyde dehydrogenase [Bacteroidales bacterium]